MMIVRGRLLALWARVGARGRMSYSVTIPSLSPRRGGGGQNDVHGLIHGKTVIRPGGDAQGEEDSHRAN